MNHKINEDNAGYFHFTWPMRLNRAVHELEGLLLGITADAQVNDKELARLTGWLGDYREFRDKQPFAEVVSMLQTVLMDRVITDEERADLLWMCTRFSDDNEAYCQVTADMQRLQGIMGGIASDGTITPAELEALQGWMEEHEHLRTVWPYDEVEAVICAVLKDGTVDEKENEALLRFFGEFTARPGHKAVELTNTSLKGLTIQGVCALAPVIEFPERLFCFTGTSKRGPRSEIERIILSRGGAFTRSLTQKTHYLVVGSDGSPCWAFSCYGRKVEEAIQLRKRGHRLQIVHEVDFWDHVR